MDEYKLNAFIRSDYFSSIADFGISHSAVWDDMACHCLSNDDALEGAHLGRSDIHGTGLFAANNFARDDVICDAFVNGSKTLGGRYVNHSPFPNARMDIFGNAIVIVALRDIDAGVEITTNYRDTLQLHIDRPKLLPGEMIEHGLDRSQLAGLDATMYDLLFNADHINNLSLSERIYAFEHAIEQYPAVDVPVTHEFIDGLYKRSATFKAGTLATGRIHTADHFDVMLTGEMMVATTQGFKHLVAPQVFTSRAGNKKAGFAIKETEWVTYHPTSSTTVEAVEAEIFCDELALNSGDLL